MAENQRFSRAHGDLVEIQLEPAPAEHLAHQIMVADRRPAHGHQKIGAARPRQRFRQAFRGVAGNAQAHGLAAHRGDVGRKSQAVGGNDLAGADGLARHHDLVAGGDEGDAGPAAHHQPGNVHGGGQADAARGDDLPGAQQHLAFLEIEPCRAHEFALFGGFFGHPHGVAVAFRVFLDDDRVGPFGQGAAGEDAGRLTGGEGA